MNTPRGDIEFNKLVDVVIELYEQTKAEDFVCSVVAFVANCKGDAFLVPVMSERGMIRLTVRPDPYCPKFEVWPLILSEEDKLRKRIKELESQLHAIREMAFVQ